MKKLHSIFFTTQLLFLVNTLMVLAVKADDVQESIINKFKEQTLNEAVSGLEVRDGGMCLFLPKGKNFITKVAINCSRLFDSLLDDLLIGNDSTLFEKDLQKKLTSANVRKRMLEILQADFALVRALLQKGSSLEDEKLSPIIPEIAKLLKLLHQGAFGQDEQFRQTFNFILQKYIHELVLLFVQYDNEESFSSLIEYVKTTVDADRTSDLGMYLVVLKGDRDALLQMLQEFIRKPDVSKIQKLKQLLEHRESVSDDTANLIQRSLAYVSGCTGTQNVAVSPCDEMFEQLEPELKITIQNSLLHLNVRNLLIQNGASLRQLATVLSQVVRKDATYYALIDELVRPYLTARKYSNDADRSLACDILGDEECTLTIEPEVAKPSTAQGFLLPIIGLSLLFIIIIGLFYYRRNYSNKAADSRSNSLNSDSLSSEERAQLRGLRKVFDLKPLDGVTELHRSYRKMVFNVHPDKLHDGGREFVDLQAQYLKTKELLDRLEQEKSHKLAND